MTASYAWQDALINAVTDPAELLQLLSLDPALLPAAQQAAQIFPLKVPRSFIARMRIGASDDPLLRQVLPLGAELDDVTGFSADPLYEAAANPLPGLLHKYHGRVLLTITSACGVHCRYCFRRAFPYEDNNPGKAGWEKVCDYIRADSSIMEVILSGGDPLTVSDARLAGLIQQLATIPHVRYLRIHSRMPILLPERITPGLIEALTATRLQPVLVVHCNHAQEIDPTVRTAMHALASAGVTLLNQSVLLKNINDSAATLIALSQALFAAGILPYYLHLLDKVSGAAHFDLPRATALALHQQMTEQLSGWLVPRLVYEVAGAAAKLNAASNNLCTA